MMNNTLYGNDLPLYPRIYAYADASYGEDMRCVPCGEVKALCPDCETVTICVFCEDACIECEGSLF